MLNTDDVQMSPTAEEALKVNETTNILKYVLGPSGTSSGKKVPTTTSAVRVFVNEIEPCAPGSRAIRKGAPKVGTTLICPLQACPAASF